MEGYKLTICMSQVGQWVEIKGRNLSSTKMEIILKERSSHLRKTVDLAAAAAAKLLQSCLTLCNPIDSSPPGSSVPGTLQARALEWVAISFSNVGK